MFHIFFLLLIHRIANKQQSSCELRFCPCVDPLLLQRIDELPMCWAVCKRQMIVSLILRLLGEVLECLAYVQYHRLTFFPQQRKCLLLPYSDLGDKVEDEFCKFYIYRHMTLHSPYEWQRVVNVLGVNNLSPVGVPFAYYTYIKHPGFI